jgi:NitT/TauT family transport system permease protein
MRNDPVQPIYTQAVRQPSVATKIDDQQSRGYKGTVSLSEVRHLAAWKEQSNKVPVPQAASNVTAYEKARKRTRARLRSTIESLAAPTLSALILLMWQFGVEIIGISEFVLPTPWNIAHRIFVDYRLLLSSSVVTIFEMVAGFALAAVGGIITALAIFYSRLFERAVHPILVALQTIPKVALAPLLVLYLGYDFAPKCFLAFLLAYFPVVIATVVGLQALDKGMVSLARSMGASEWQIFFKIRLPAALPNVFGGFKVAISLAVIGAVIGEYVAAERGLGYLQLQASSQFDTTLSFAAVVVIALIGVFLFAVLDFIERRAVFHRESAK